MDPSAVLVSAREAARADELARAVAARGLTIEITKAPRDRLFERISDDGLVGVVLDHVTDPPLLRVIADATDRRRRLAVVVVGPIEPTVDALVAFASGVSAYLAPGNAADEVADAVTTALAGEVVLPPAISTALVHGLRGQDRGIVVDGVDGASIVLTHREWEVLVQLRQARTTAEIARRFVVSSGTIRTHIGAIVRKLGVAGRVGLFG